MRAGVGFDTGAWSERVDREREEGRGAERGRRSARPSPDCTRPCAHLLPSRPALSCPDCPTLLADPTHALPSGAETVLSPSSRCRRRRAGATPPRSSLGFHTARARFRASLDWLADVESIVGGSRSAD